MEPNEKQASVEELMQQMELGQVGDTAERENRPRQQWSIPVSYDTQPSSQPREEIPQFTPARQR